MPGSEAETGGLFGLIKCPARPAPRQGSQYKNRLPHSPCHLPQEGSFSIKTGCLQTLHMELSFGKIAAFPFCLGCWEALNQSYEHVSGST